MAKLALGILAGLIVAVLVAMATWSVAYLTGGWIDPLDKFSNSPPPPPPLTLIPDLKTVPRGGSSIVTLVESEQPCPPYTILWARDRGKLEVLVQEGWKPLPPGPTGHRVVRWVAPEILTVGHIEARLTDCHQKMWIAEVAIPIVVESPPR